MTARYPSFAQRKQTAKRRDQEMKRALVETRGLTWNDMLALAPPTTTNIGVYPYHWPFNPPNQRVAANYGMSGVLVIELEDGTRLNWPRIDPTWSEMTPEREALIAEADRYLTVLKEAGI